LRHSTRRFCNRGVRFAFDPRRTATLLLGGDKIGDQGWYEVNVPRADVLYGEQIRTLEQEFIEAINGELVLAARFPDGVEVPIGLTEAEDAA
jgi:hypothetical protein